NPVVDVDAHAAAVGVVDLAIEDDHDRRRLREHAEAEGAVGATTRGRDEGELKRDPNDRKADSPVVRRPARGRERRTLGFVRRSVFALHAATLTRAVGKAGPIVLLPVIAVVG